MTDFSAQIQDGALKPHKEDSWCDAVLLSSEHCPYSFTMHIQERYKTSQLSGNEWRFSGVCQVKDKGRVIAAQSYGDLEAAFAFFPRLLGEEGINESLIRPNDAFTALYSYKGHTLLNSTYTHLIEAMLFLPGSWYEVPEQSIVFEASTKARASLCTQPGCQQFPITLLKIKQEYDHRGKAKESSQPLYRQFCGDHLHRGDCGLEDADVNYELVAGISPDDRVVNPDLVSPSRTVVL